MSEVIITVRGESEQRVSPERAVAHVSASIDGPDRRDVVDRVSALSAAVREHLSSRQAAGELVEWSSQQMSVFSHRPWNNEGVQLDLVHQASVEFAATFDDVAKLSEWLGGVAETDGLHVGHIAWELTSQTRARLEREVAEAAVTVAVDRAAAYASAIGLRTVTPIEIADLGLLTAQPPTMESRMIAKASMAMDVGAPGIDLSPTEIVVTAGVEARFRAS